MLISLSYPIINISRLDTHSEFVAGYTFAKSVKWTFHNEAIDYGYGTFFHMYAYQNLWTSYDVWKTGDSVYTKVFIPAEFRDDSWRLIPRILIVAAVVIGALSAGILLLGSLVPICNRKLVVLNSCRIASSVLSFCAGGLLVSSLIIYQNKYQSILTSLFDDPANQYPDKENISVGFYLTAFASAMFFASSVLNIANVIIDTKASQASVQPTSGQLNL
ncbi:unnamed protein product [Mytilus edulis]|uniref:Uncharacterized protein n=1 Tax=Mytilus edulis TaxID=6550 RepID=A0A8S3RWB9_MYTED|nr:unnamed protein product [Mytilus edulis]